MAALLGKVRRCEVDGDAFRGQRQSGCDQRGADPFAALRHRLVRKPDEDEGDAAGRDLHLTHRKVYRPWGAYEGIDAGANFQVKHITVNPGAKLSLQMHHKRAEHWIVVSGTAQVTCDDKVFPLHANQSTYIPLGAKHRLENPGVEPLHLIEVQSGAYLGEDDIVRFEDTYGRAPAESKPA